MKLKYDNITISGGVAVGKGTLLNNLKPYLEPYGWKFRASGQIVRDYTKEYIKPNASLAPDELHKKIDSKVLELLKNETKWAIEAWLSGWLARKLTKTLRILLICSDKALQIDRVANRDKISVTDAKKFIEEREEDNIRTFKRIYNAVDIFNSKYYQLVTDTYSLGPLETAGKVLDKMGYQAKHTLNKIK